MALRSLAFALTSTFVVTLSAGALGTAARAAVVAPGSDYAGRSQYAWSAAWWQVFLQAEAAGNPLLSGSPGDSLARVNSTDPAVFFLTGSGDGAPLQHAPLPPR